MTTLASATMILGEGGSRPFKTMDERICVPTDMENMAKAWRTGTTVQHQRPGILSSGALPYLFYTSTSKYCFGLILAAIL